jgi:HSP20 family protein
MALTDDFRREMDKVFERFFGGELESVPASASWTPRVDVEETESEMVVKADLPGVAPEDVEVTVKEGVLVLRGSRKEEKEEKEKNSVRIERFVGEFYRAIPLPAVADEEKIEAEAAKGVLTIRIPKSEKAMPKKIEVKATE